MPYSSPFANRTLHLRYFTYSPLTSLSYQVLIDADMIKDSQKLPNKLLGALEQTLQGKVKPMITQCSIRHLYTSDASNAATKTAWIETAKSFERRRCNHHELPEPLTTIECLSEVVDPKSSGTNKHRYVVASQDQEVRAKMRTIAGVPLIYINRSVMIMEPMAAKTEEIREQGERDKVRAGLKGRRGNVDLAGSKRKRDEEEDEPASKAKKRKGPKGPNPLAVKKPKKRPVQADAEAERKAIRNATKEDPQVVEKALDAETAASTEVNADPQAPVKKKRRRKHKSGGEGLAATPGDDAADVAAGDS
ncbi:hypothetical protein H2203_004997 [Taxawa tesnikishii (nom. ined.)]|nr:hypothetical protein H2203_004997 [Dothideales sp. JES 119]